MSHHETLEGVPQLSRNDLMAEIARINVPYRGQDDADHPVPLLLNDLRLDHPVINNWGGRVGNILNDAMGGSDRRPAVERYAFDNAYIAAYGLVRHCYWRTGREMPRDNHLPQDYQFVRPWGVRRSHHVLVHLNDRQHRLNRYYPEFLEAVQAYAYERMPHHGQRQTVGAVAIAASEIYHTFNWLHATLQYGHGQE